MSPIDDELRRALSGRAQAVTPAADPLAGIERRARQIRRNRVGAAIAGSALAVAAVAAVIPAVQSATSAPQRGPQYAVTPTPEPTSAPVSQDGRPAAAVAWGQPLDQQLDQAFLQQWDSMHAKPAGSSKGEVLFRGETNESVQVHVYQLWFDSSTAYAVVGYSSEAGPEIARGTELAPGTLVVDAVVPGLDFPALVIAHDPALPTVQYAPDGTTFDTIEDDEATGVIAQRTGPGPDSKVADRIRLLDRAGRVAYDAPVWTSDETDSAPEGEPAAALDPDRPWAVRGDRSLVTDGQLQALGDDWAQRHGVAADQVRVTPLYVQRSQISADTEVVYLVRFRDNPWMWGVSTLGEGGWSWYVDNELAPGTRALAAALPGDASGERLLVVAAPWTGGAVYAADGRAYEPMTDQDVGVFMAAIDPGDTDDRFKVLDGDGDLDDPVSEGPAPDFQNAG